MPEGRLDRRESPRFRLKKGVFAAIRPDFQRVGQILDAGAGGLGLAYITDMECLQPGRVTVDVYSEDHKEVIRRVPCRVVYEVDDAFSPRLSVRRCGLQFQDLTDEQSHRLREIFRFYQA